MEHNHMVETLTPNGPNHPLHVRSLPWRTRRREHFLYSHVSYLSSEVIAEDRVAVPQQVAWELVKGKCFPQLLPSPLGGRVAGHIEVNNAATIMGQYQKHVKDVETDCGDGEEIDGDELRDVVLQEGAPSLSRRFAAAHHVFADTRLADVNAEFEPFAMNAWCAPTGILPAHLADQISGLARNNGSSGLSAPNLPSPKQATTLAMPGHDRLGLNDDQRRAPIAPKTGQTAPEEAIP